MTPTSAQSLKTALQQAKHRAFLAYKPHRFAVAGAVEPLLRTAHRIKPPHFDPSDWPDTHLPHNEPLTRETTEAVPRRIFVFWTGENPLSPNRQRALDEMRRTQLGLDVVLVTPCTLDQFVLPEHPLHPAYEHLSLIHRSDYLRCYALNFHGGGYADLKAPGQSWAPVFDRIDDSDAWLAGYRVPVRLMGPNIPDPGLERAMKQFSEHRLGQCSYISRPDTPISREWWRELNHRLDTLQSAVADCPGNARGDNAGYPVVFTSILAQVLDPLQVKYREHLLYDNRLRPDLDNYI